MDEEGWWFRFRMWVHNLTHVHMTATKDDVAEIQFCRRRGQRKTTASISFPVQEGLDQVFIYDIQVPDLKYITESESALDLRRRAIRVGGKGVIQ